MGNVATVAATVVASTLLLVAVGPPSSAATHEREKGWKPVAYGTAVVSVPPSWHVEYELACPSGEGTVVMLGTPDGRTCPSAPSGYVFWVRPLGPWAATLGGDPTRRLHGLVVYEVPQELGAHGLTWAVPSLGVELTGQGPAARAVAGTLRRLHGSPATHTPKGWKLTGFSSLGISVPDAWVVTLAPACPGSLHGWITFGSSYVHSCGQGHTVNGVSVVTLGTVDYKTGTKRTVNGLTVYEKSYFWWIPSLDMNVWAKGPVASAVRHTVVRL